MSRHSLPLTLALLISACTSVGPDRVRSDQVSYADALSEAAKRQTLLNIVKIGHGDYPSFISVAELQAGYTSTRSASLGTNIITGFDLGDDLAVGAGGTFSESPSVKYRPLTGAALQNALLKPVPPDQLVNLLVTGTGGEVALGLGAQSIGRFLNGSAAPSTGEPAEPNFTLAVSLLDRLARTGRLVVEQGQGRPNHPPEQRQEQSGLPAVLTPSTEAGSGDTATAADPSYADGGVGPETQPQSEHSADPAPVEPPVGLGPPQPIVPPVAPPMIPAQPPAPPPVAAEPPARAEPSTPPGDPDELVTVIRFAGDGVANRDSAEVRLRSLLGLRADIDAFVLEEGFGRGDGTTIRLRTRTLREVMNAAALGVERGGEQPKRPRGLLPATDEHLPVRIERSLTPPMNSFASVRYGNQWFYIDEDDLASRRGLSFVMLLLDLAQRPG